MAFTLIELLSVSAILAVLASLLLPAILKAKNRGNDIGCINNLREWGRGTALYTAEHNDHLPQDGTPNGLSRDSGWYIDLPKALGLPPYYELPWRTNAAINPGRSLWICPSNKRRSNGNNLFHYCLNEHVNGRGSGRQVDVTTIRHPAATVWMFDNGKLAAVAQQNNVHPNLHQGGAQFLFLDGHAARFMSAVYWDLKNDRGITNNAELRWIP